MRTLLSLCDVCGRVSPHPVISNWRGFEWIIYGIENATLFITNQPIMEWFIGQYCNLYVFLCKSRVHLKGNG